VVLSPQQSIESQRNITAHMKKLEQGHSSEGTTITLISRFLPAHMFNQRFIKSSYIS